MLDTLHSKPAESLRGTIQVAGDKSISHRALTRLGVRIEVADGSVRVHDCIGRFRSGEQPIYLGNSGTSID